MHKLIYFVRRAAGMFLLVILALLFFLVFRLTLPISPPEEGSTLQTGSSLPEASPPSEALLFPAGTPTSQLYPLPGAPLNAADTPTGQPYPLPGEGTPEPTSLPTPIPTSTPWRVSDLPALKAYPRPGPFREMRILYVDHAKGGYFVTGLSGKEQIQWPAWPEDQADGEPTSMLHVSPDGSQILYSLWCVGPGCDWKLTSIWTMNPDGGSKRKLVGASDDWYPMDAIWSPNGERVAYIGARPDQESGMPASHELWVMNSDGSQPKQVLSGDKLIKLGIESPPPFFRWMGNGYIYFAKESLYAVNPEDGGLYRLMDGVDALHLSFALSPDGQRARAFTDISTKILGAAGFLTADLPPDNSGTVWSPDGSRLAYIVRGGGGAWMRDLVSGKERQLLPYTPGVEVQLKAFSPDNRYLAYQTDAGLYIIDLESKGFNPEPMLTDPHEPVSGYRALDFIAWIPVQ